MAQSQQGLTRMCSGCVKRGAKRPEVSLCSSKPIVASCTRIDSVGDSYDRVPAKDHQSRDNHNCLCSVPQIASSRRKCAMTRRSRASPSIIQSRWLATVPILSMATTGSSRIRGARSSQMQVTSMWHAATRALRCAAHPEFADISSQLGTHQLTMRVLMNSIEELV